MYIFLLALQQPQASHWYFIYALQSYCTIYAFYYFAMDFFQTFLNKCQDPILSIPYVVVGGDTTALMAAQGIRLQNPKAKVSEIFMYM